VGDENRTDAGVWEIGEVQGVNCAVNFRFEKYYPERSMKKPTRSGLEGTLREGKKLKARVSVETWGCGLLKGKRIVETEVAAYISLSYVRGTK
jgi:hypothetical protein